MLAPRQHQRIDQPVARDQRALGALELGAEKAMIEAGIVDHQRRIADEGQEFIDHIGEAFVGFQELRR